jgi:hypothetical protein
MGQPGELLAVIAKLRPDADEIGRPIPFDCTTADHSAVGVSVTEDPRRASPG